MIKRTKNISINIISVFVILITVLLACVSSTNAWFTQTKQNGIKVEVVVANLNLQLYQTINSSEVKILTTVKNSEYETDDKDSTQPQYLTLSGKIMPDEFVPITLTLKNEDAGTSSMYVRFKMELYRRTINGDEFVPIEIMAGGIPNGKTAGFGLKNDDSSGYCYYQNNQQINTMFEKETSAIMLTQFKVPYTSFIDANGNMLIVDSETCYIKIIVEASLYQDFRII